MCRVLEKLRSFVLKDNTGLLDDLRANWATFISMTVSGRHSLERSQHHWLATTSGTLLVHFSLRTAELLVNGNLLARLPSMFRQFGFYKPLFSESR